MRYFILLMTLPVAISTWASDIIPTGDANNTLYYQIGGASDFMPPPVSDTQTINLGANANLGLGNTCGAFNPALSMTNTLNNLQQQAENIEQSVLSNATGSLVEMPMYFLAQADPTAYSMINNAIINASKKLEISTKSCQDVHSQIAQGKNPYQDWGTIAVGDQWKQQLSLTSTGQEDINTAKATIDQTAGNTGVPWVQGTADGRDSGYHAGGLNQPPIRVIADTVKAGYNAMLMRDLNDSSPAPAGGELANEFPAPHDAVAWITNVVGDQTVTTCTSSSCTSQQAGISGRGLLPWITTCGSQNQTYCASTIQTNLTNLVTGQTALTKQNLEAVSASGLVISPQIIAALQTMEPIQQNLMITKLAQEVSTQQVVERALTARHLLQTGSQVPVIAANGPAQTSIHHAIQQLDDDIKSLSFESDIRRNLMSNTLVDVLNYQTNQQAAALQVTPVKPTPPLLQNSAISNPGAAKQ